eukprot:scaffold6735_cov124-Isochrysis_galbana.AAC.3
MTLRMSPAASRPDVDATNGPMAAAEGSSVLPHSPSSACPGRRSCAASARSRRASIARLAVRFEPAAWTTDSLTGRLFTTRTVVMAARTLAACFRAARTRT